MSSNVVKQQMTLTKDKGATSLQLGFTDRYQLCRSHSMSAPYFQVIFEEPKYVMIRAIAELFWTDV